MNQIISELTMVSIVCDPGAFAAGVTVYNSFYEVGGGVIFLFIHSFIPF